MALHRRRTGETVAQERKRLKNTGHNTGHASKRKDTVAGRATKRRNKTPTQRVVAKLPRGGRRGR